MSEPTINDMMHAYALDAVDFAHSNFGVSLDFTVESIQRIETITQTLFERRPKGFLARLFGKGPSENEVQTVSKILGGYIGEVYRRQTGGEWAINENFQAIGVQTGSSWIFPASKVYKRLTNGEEDNLWFYFSVLTSDEYRGLGDSTEPDQI